MAINRIEEMAAAMRKRWHEIDPESDGHELVPWERADKTKKAIWVEIAIAGAEVLGDSGE